MPAICIASCTPVQAALAYIPIALVAYGAVVEIASDELIAAIAPILGVHLDEAVLPVAVAGSTLGEAVSAYVPVAAVTFGAMGVWPADGLVADVAIQIHFHGRVGYEVGEVLGCVAVALLLLPLI